MDERFIFKINCGDMFQGKWITRLLSYKLWRVKFPPLKENEAEAFVRNICRKPWWLFFRSMKNSFSVEKYFLKWAAPLETHCLTCFLSYYFYFSELELWKWGKQCRKRYLSQSVIFSKLWPKKIQCEFNLSSINEQGNSAREGNGAELNYASKENAWHSSQCEWQACFNVALDKWVEYFISFSDVFSLLYNIPILFNVQEDQKTMKAKMREKVGSQYGNCNVQKTFRAQFSFLFFYVCLLPNYYYAVRLLTWYLVSRFGQKWVKSTLTIKSFTTHSSSECICLLNFNCTHCC